jgi:Paraquat-inducible protein B
MAMKSNPKLIGLFALGALALFVVGIIIIGGGKLWKQTIPVVMYFPRSVAGLNVGAPVTFRGVKLGEVTDIFIGYQPSTRDVVIPVFADIFPDSIVTITGTTDSKHLRKDSSILRDYISERGLRAQLSVSSLVTGQLVVNLDFYPYAVMQEEVDSFPGRIEIPTVPSTLEEVQATLQDLYGKLSKLPLEDMINDVRQLLQGANQLVNSPKVQVALDQAAEAITRLNHLAGTLDGQVGPLMTQAGGAVEQARSAFASIDARAGEARKLIGGGDQAVADARKALETLQQLLSNANSLIQPGSPLNYELTTALRDLGAAARSISALANTLDRTPNAVIFGRTQSEKR